MKTTKYVLAIASYLMAFQLNAAEGVARSTFTTAIDNREPVDEVSSIDTDSSKIYYFTEIKGLKDQRISHRWEQNGEVQATVNFDIGGDRWRVWSSKNLQPEFTGEWQVMVVDEAGNVLAQNTFNYGDGTEQSTGQADTISDTTADQATEQSMAETAKKDMKDAQATTMPSEEELSKIAPAAGGTPAPATAE